MVSERWVAMVIVATLVACGGNDGAPAGAPPREPPPQESSRGAPAGQEEGQADTAEASTGLVRETFTFRGAGRDPFVSLLKSGDVRPLAGDLRVTSIAYNEQYPGNSVAVLRDTSQAPERRYTVRVGDRMGRLRIVQIRQREVVVVFDEFGVERQEVLRLLVRRQEEE
jgi:hypothetical protein